MPVFDYECQICKKQFDKITKENEVVKCPCGNTATRIFPQKAPSFKLKYNPRKDKVDWDGNTTRFYDEWKKQKAEGKDVVIPEEKK